MKIEIVTRPNRSAVHSIRPNIQGMAAYKPGEQPQGTDVIKLNTNENPYPPSPRAIDAMSEVLQSGRLRKYPDPTGRAFREAAGKLYGVDPDGILIGNGSDDILTILTRAFVPEKGEIVSPTPSYLLYKTLAEIQGAKFATVTFDRLDSPTSVWTAWPKCQTNLTFIANPNSPTGAIIATETLEALSRRLLNGPLIIDEAYADFAETNAISLISLENVIITRTLSKSYSLAGLRFGFAMTTPEIVRELVKVKDSYNCDSLSLAGAQAAIEDQDYFQKTRARIIATRNRMTSELKRLGFEVQPSHANFVWTTYPYRTATYLYEELKKRNILIRYINYPDHGDGLRISVGTDAEIDQLLDELKKII